MKTRKLIFAGVLFSGLACLVGMVSCNTQPTEETARAAVEKKGGMVVTTEVAQPEATEAVAAVQRTRLEQFGVKKAYVKVTDDNEIIAIIPDVKDPDRVRRLLQAAGRLEFWETYENSEVYPRLKQLNDVLLANGDESLIGLLNPFVTADGEAMRGPAVGLVHASDTTRLRAMLTSAEANDILQRDARLVWSAKPVREDAPYYHLIALKAMRDGRAALGGEVITAAKVEHNKWSPEPVIDLSMNAEGAKCWQYLTRDNVGKSIGIVVDGQLYSYPTVMCEIECGRSQITGNFTEEEAADLANMLSSGVLPCPVRIVEEQIIESQK
jgi:SecD/SecF fusion protein